MNLNHQLLALAPLPTNVQPQRFSYRTPFRTLKRVSGKLREFLRRTHPAPPSESKKPQLLIVDDEESICFSMKEYFSDRGFVVDTAREIDEAEQLIENGDYAVLIQDLRIGIAKGPNGFAVIRLARSHNPDMRIVVLTAHGSSEAESEARTQRVDAFLRKHQPLSQVAQVVRGLVQSPRRRTASQAL